VQIEYFWMSMLFTLLAACSLTILNLLFRIWTRHYGFNAFQFGYDGQIVQSLQFIAVNLWFGAGDQDMNLRLLMAAGGFMAALGSTMVGVAVSIGKAGPS